MSNRFVTSLIRSVVVVTAFCLLFTAGSFAATLKIGGTGAALGTMRILADQFVRMRPDISVVIPDSLGSGGGIKAVLAGALPRLHSTPPRRSYLLPQSVPPIPHPASRRKN